VELTGFREAKGGGKPRIKGPEGVELQERERRAGKERLKTR